MAFVRKPAATATLVGHGKHPVTGERLPIYTLDTRSLTLGDVVALPDGGRAYYDDQEPDDPPGLYRRALAMDPGDNIVRERVAPASVAGLAHGHSGMPPLRIVCAEQVGLVR